MRNATRVGVLRGGPSSEYEVSLNTGANVLSALREKCEQTYESHDIFIDKQGHWHMDGLGMPAERIVPKIDVAFIALHGAYGEDGKVQAFFEAHGLPFTGSGSLASAVGMNKSLSKKIFRDNGIQVPFGREYNNDRVEHDLPGLIRELFNTLLLPAVVKPVASGSSAGVSIVRSYDDLEEALQKATRYGDAILIEEYIGGAEATVGLIEGFRGRELYALPVVEIRSKNGFFDYEAKYTGQSEEVVPASFSADTKKSLEDLAGKVHRALGLRHYSRTDFIIHPKRGIYVLETNTLPGLTGESLVPKALRAVGSDTHELVDHLIRLAVAD